FLQERRVVALHRPARAGTPRGCIARRHLEQKSQIGPPSTRVERFHERALGFFRLVGQRRVIVAVAHHMAAARQLGLDLARELIHSIGRNQKGQGGARPLAMPAPHDFAQQAPDRAIRGLPGRVSGPPASVQPLDEQSGLRGGACAIDAFNHDEPALRHASCRELYRSGRRLARAPSLADAQGVLRWLVIALTLTGCRPRAASGPEQDSPPLATLAGVACIRQQEGCILCVARHTPAEVEERVRRLCNPKKTTECTEFCTTLAAECATPWRSGPNCLAQSEDEFRRQQFWLEAADRPSAELVGRVLDAESKKLDGARVELADGPTVVAEATTGKDGGFRIPLRVGSYTMRVSRSGYATQLETVRLLADKAPPFHVLRMSPEERISGHVLEGSGAPVAGVTVLAVRVTADPLSVAEAQTGADGAFTLRGLDAHRYALRVLAFGYRAVETPRVQAPATRVLWHLERTHIVRGLVT